jgi:hypothetical protein
LGDNGFIPKEIRMISNGFVRYLTGRWTNLSTIDEFFVLETEDDNVVVGLNRISDFYITISKSETKEYAQEYLDDMMRNEM